MDIKEILVVEGRDDSAAIKRSVNAETIETHGFGIKGETWDLIEKAYREKGIIIFTDPDFSGDRIRRKLAERFPNAKHAYLTPDSAYRDGDIGVENACPEAIRDAILKSRAGLENVKETFTYSDIRRFGMTGSKNASAMREKVGNFLGIGYGNAASFLNKLNKYGVTSEELDEAILACGDSGASKKIRI